MAKIKTFFINGDQLDVGIPANLSAESLTLDGVTLTSAQLSALLGLLPPGDEATRYKYAGDTEWRTVSITGPINGGSASATA